jgi:hypothetical protein
VVVTPVAGHRGDRSRGEFIAALAGVAGVQHQQYAPDPGFEQHLSCQLRRRQGVGDVVRVSVCGEQQMLVGVVEDFAVAANVDGHNVVRLTGIIQAEGAQQSGQLVLARVEAQGADVLVAEVFGEQRDDLVAGLYQPRPVPLLRLRIVRDRRRDQVAPRPFVVSGHASLPRSRPR